MDVLFLNVAVTPVASQGVPGLSFQDLDRSMLQMVVSTRQLPVWWTRCSREVGSGSRSGCLFREHGK